METLRAVEGVCMSRVYIGDRQLNPDEEPDVPDDGLTDAERRQKEFDDFDPPDNDYGGDEWNG